MITEIGHFYISEKRSEGDLVYLKEERFSETDILVIFIDNYSSPERKLNVSNLYSECVGIIGRDDIQIVYESEMCKYYFKYLALLDQSKIERVSINGVETETRYDGRKIYDHKTQKISCQMLSYIWQMYRIDGMLEDCKDVPQQTLTVIHKKYLKLEQRVFHMIPEKYRHLVFYRFFGK